MKIYNTLTRKKEEFVPIDKDEVKIMSAARRCTIISILAMRGRLLYSTH